MESRKRKFGLIETSLESGFAKRQRAWLRRECGEQPSSWRPTKLHRTSARKWVLALDSQIAHSTDKGGLAWFIYDASSPTWSDWRQWPLLTIASDLGSDGVAGFNALCWGYDAHVVLYPDPSHAVQRSFENALKGAGVWNLILLCVISWNLDYGPWQEESRRTELEHAMTIIYSKYTPADCPVFQAALPRMVVELESAGIVSFDRERPLEEEVWDFLGERSRKPAAGRRTALNRFLGAYNAASKFGPWWSVTLWERTALAIESGSLRGRHLAEKVATKAQEADMAASANTSTDGKRLQLEDRTLRACCSNAVAISCMTLQEHQHRRVLELVVVAGRPLNEWHTTQNRKLRSISDSEEWLLQELTGGFMQHLVAFIRLLEDPGSLCDAGFELLQGGDLASKRLAGPQLELETLVENEYSHLFGMLCLGMLRQHLTRSLWLFSWPYEMFGALSSDLKEAEIIARFAKDEAAFKAFAGREVLSAAARACLRRHLLHMRANKQLCAAFDETGHVMTDDLRQVLRSHLRVNLQSQIVEDVQAEQKANSALKAVRRFRKPSTSMAIALEKDVIANRHKFKNLPLDVPVSYGARIPKAAFQTTAPQAQPMFDSMVSTTAAPPWFSPSAANLCTPVADLALVRQAFEENAWGVFDDAWAGEICDLKNMLIIRLPAEPSSVTCRWFLALHWYPKSAALLWPCEVVEVPDCSQKVVSLKTDLHRPILRPITNFAEGSRAASVQWRSWLWQVRNLPNRANSFKPGIRMFLSGSEDTIARVACRAAWWNLPRSSLVLFARALGLDVASSATLFDLLWALIESQLQLTPEETLSLCHLRVARENDDEEISSALLQVDEAVAVMDRNDIDRVKQAQKAASTKEENKAAFRRAFMAKAQDIESVRVAKARKRQAPGRAQNRIPIPHHITQAQAKRLLPPHTSLWRDVQRSGWCGHNPPNSRVSEAFDKHGGSSDEALKALLRRLWRQHAESKGKEPEELCIVQGLF